jgi:hypothetical protein
MAGGYRLSSALDLIVNPRVGSVNPYPDEVNLHYGPKPFRPDQRPIALVDDSKADRALSMQEQIHNAVVFTSSSDRTV